jgi:hypothetical protein
MPLSDYAISTLFLIFLMLFLLIGNSPALHRWLDRVTGMARREGEAAPEKAPGEEAPGGMSRQVKDYEAIIFLQLALAGDKGLSPTGLSDNLHFDKPIVEKTLASMEAQGLVRRGGLLGRRFHLSERGREHAVQEGIIPRLRIGEGR